MGLEKMFYIEIYQFREVLIERVLLVEWKCEVNS